MQGSLSEFRLAEILQLVAVQQKTGLLRLVRGKQLITLYFNHGVLIASRDRRHSSFDPLLDYLTRIGWLQEEMASFLRTRMEGSKEDLADVLLSERFLTESELRGTIEDLAQELVYQAFTWREGNYQFVGGEEAIQGIRNGVSLKIDTLLMEAARRADEWPRLLERLPGPDVVLDLARSPSTSLGERAFLVLSQLSGAMRLGDLIRRAHVDEFEVYEIVVQAVEAGDVRILEKPPVAPDRAPRDVAPRAAALHDPAPVPRRKLKAPRDLWSLPRPAGWGFALALAISVLSVGAAYLAASLVGNGSSESVDALESACARERVRMQIEVYHALQGRVPSALEDLVSQDLVSQELIELAQPLRYAPAADGTSFTLAVPEPEPATETN